MPLTGATVEGKAEAERAFAHIGEKVADAAAISAELAAIGLDAARSAAPTGATGQLVASITSEVGSNEAELEAAVGYAEFVEFGTVHMPGVRFIGAGYDAMAARAEAIATDWVQGIVDDADRMA